MAGDERKNKIRQCIFLFLFIFAFLTLACTMLRAYSNRAAGQNTKSEAGTHGERRNVIAALLVQVNCRRISYDCMLGEMLVVCLVPRRKGILLFIPTTIQFLEHMTSSSSVYSFRTFTIVYNRQCVAWHSSSFSCFTTFFLCRRFYCEYAFFVQHLTLTLRLWDISRWSLSQYCNNNRSALLLFVCVYLCTCWSASLIYPILIVSTACVTRSDKMSYFGEECTK